jgi:hypothetical protein
VVFRHEGAHRRGQQTKVIHAAVATAANVADTTILPDLLHGGRHGYGAIKPTKARPT